MFAAGQLAPQWKSDVWSGDPVQDHRKAEVNGALGSRFGGRRGSVVGGDPGAVSRPDHHRHSEQGYQGQAPDHGDQRKAATVTGEIWQQAPHADTRSAGTGWW